MDRITGTVAKLNTSALAKLFPSYDPESPQRKPNQVDFPLGHDYFGLFPKYEEAKCGENLSIMWAGGDLESAFKVPTPIWLKETEYDSNLVKTIHNSAIKYDAYHVYLYTHPEFQPDCVSLVEVFDNSEKHVISENQTDVIESLIGRLCQTKSGKLHLC